MQHLQATSTAKGAGLFSSQVGLGGVWDDGGNEHKWYVNKVKYCNILSS